MQEELIVLTERDRKEIQKVLQRSRHWDRDRLAALLAGRPIAPPKLRRVKDPFQETRMLDQ